MDTEVIAGRRVFRYRKHNKESIDHLVFKTEKTSMCGRVNIPHTVSEGRVNYNKVAPFKGFASNYGLTKGGKWCSECQRKALELRGLSDGGKRAENLDQAVEMIDELIVYWRNSVKETSKFYVDALQSARKNIVGEELE